jgi:hypothetical protein
VRFAFHKLLVSQVRAGAHLVRSGKDILQAAQVFAALVQERPGDIDLAWEAVRAKGKKWVTLVQKGLRALSHQFPEIYQEVKASTARSSRR